MPDAPLTTIQMVAFWFAVGCLIIAGAWLAKVGQRSTDDENGRVTFELLVQVGALLILLVLAVLAVRSSVTNG